MFRNLRQSKRDFICRICLSQITSESDYDCIYNDTDDTLKLNLSEFGILYENLFNLEISLSEDRLPIYLCNYCTLQLKLFNKFKTKAIESYKFLNKLNYNEKFDNENIIINEFDEDETVFYELKCIENEVYSKNIEITDQNQKIINLQLDELENLKNIKRKRFPTLKGNQTNCIELMMINDGQIEEVVCHNKNNKFVNNKEINMTRKLNNCITDNECVTKNNNDVLRNNFYKNNKVNNNNDNDSIEEEEFEEVQYLDEEFLDSNEYEKNDNFDNTNKIFQNYDDSLITKEDDLNNDIIINKNQNDESHKEQVHRDYIEFKKFHCKICNKNFNTKFRLYHHKTNEHGRVKLSCNQCKKKFYFQDTLESHLRIHSGLPAYQCSECPKTFKQKANYNYHMKSHQNERNDQCYICDKAFITKSDLKVHMRVVHNNERRYKCDICGKRYKVHTHMTNHRHSHYEKLECEICHQKYSCPNVLRTHIKAVHLGELPYQCEKCNKKFKRKHHLKAHYRVHMKSRLRKQNFGVLVASPTN